MSDRCLSNGFRVRFMSDLRRLVFTLMNDQNAMDRPASASNCMNRLPVNLATQPPLHRMVPPLLTTVP